MSIRVDRGNVSIRMDSTARMVSGVRTAAYEPEDLVNAVGMVLAAVGITTEEFSARLRMNEDRKVSP